MSFKKIFLSITLLFIVYFLKAQGLIIGTYNLRYDNPRDTGNLWVNRAPIVASVIRFHDFDVFGTQEGLKNQLDYLGTSLPQYNRYGAGRDDGKDKGEHSAIFYKQDEFNLLIKVIFGCPKHLINLHLDGMQHAVIVFVHGYIYSTKKVGRNYIFLMHIMITRAWRLVKKAVN